MGIIRSTAGWQNQLNNLLNQDQPLADRINLINNLLTKTYTNWDQQHSSDGQEWGKSNKKNVRILDNKREVK